MPAGCAIIDMRHMTDLRQQLLCRVKNRAHHAVIAHERDANGKVVQFVWSAYGDGRSLYEVVREGQSLARGPCVQEAVDLYVQELAGVAMNDTTDGKWQDCQENDGSNPPGGLAETPAAAPADWGVGVGCTASLQMNGDRRAVLIEVGIRDKRRLQILLPRSLSAMAALECEVAMMSEDEVSKHLEQHKQYAVVKSNAKIHP